MLFLLETDGKWKKNKTFAVYVIQFPIKLCLFQPSRYKTSREDSFLSAKTVSFQEKGKTHHNTILTMCTIYNVNNNKTADIYFYYYIDEII